MDVVVPAEQQSPPTIRPQTLLLTVFGRHIATRRLAISSATAISVLEQVDVTPVSARSTLARLVQRDYLERHRRGRHAYFSLTPLSYQLVTVGAEQVMNRPINDGSDEWTLLSFSIPEEKRKERHSLRMAITWRGFVPMRSGLWIAPGRANPAEAMAELGLQEYVHAFVGRPFEPHDIERLIGDLWDLPAVAAGYRAFCDRWSPSGSAVRELRSPLGRQTVLLAEWRLLVGSDPQLPTSYLPDGWPAAEAHEVFLEHHDDLSAAAAEEFASLRETIDV